MGVCLNPCPIDTSSDLVRNAYAFASNAHRGQRRIDGIRPYIVHPILVANLLLEHGHTKPELLAAAFLHDVMEDCNVRHVDLVNYFNQEVADLVESVSDNPIIGRTASKQHMLKMGHLLPTDSKILKCADRLANLMDLYEFEPTVWHKGAIQGYTKSSIQLINVLACDENKSIRDQVYQVADKIYSRYGQ